MISYLSKIGQGSYSSVYLAELTEGNEKVQVAVKCLDSKYGLETPWELEILSKERSPYLLHSISTIKHGNGIAIVLPLAKFTLRQFLQSRPTFSAMETVISNIFSGMAALHCSGFYHLDFKSDNVLIFDDRAVICDFSLSLPKTFWGVRKEVVTITSRPPELLFQTGNQLVQLSEKIDSWSMGIVILEILTGFHLRSRSGSAAYSEIQKMFSDQNRRTTLTSLLSSSPYPEQSIAYLEILESLLDPNPVTRGSICSFFPTGECNLERNILYSYREKLIFCYDWIEKLCRSFQTQWSTYLNAMTLLEEFTDQKQHITSRSKLLAYSLAAMKLSIQLEEEITLDYRSLISCTGGALSEIDLILAEQDLVLTLGSPLHRQVLKSPLPHLTNSDLQNRMSS